MNSSSLIVRRLIGDESPRVYRQIAVLHADLIHGGILPLLGEDFLAVLYRQIAASRWGSVHAARRDGEVIGFAAGARDFGRCALGFSLSSYLRLGFIFLIRMWRPQILRKVFDILAYPFRIVSQPHPAETKSDAHRAELLAIAVSRSAQATGLGRTLVQAFEETLQGKVSHYMVTTNTVEIQSNAFYSALGFAKAGQQRHHELVIQIYTKQVR